VNRPMFSIQQSIKEHIAWNAGYSAGQEHAHRFYHMMFTGKQESKQAGGNVEQLQGKLGKHGDDGYSLEQHPDTTVLVRFKEAIIAAIPEVAATPERIDRIIQCHKERLQQPAEVTQ